MQQKLFILPLICYFLLYLISCIFGRHIWGNVGDKLLFLLVPVLGYPIFNSRYFSEKLTCLFKFFIAGLVVISLYQLVRSVSESISMSAGIVKFNPIISPGVSRFNWEQLSTLEHPTYLNIKILWAIAILLFLNDKLKIKAIYRILLVFLFSVMIFLLSVKSGMLILLFLLLYFLFSHKKGKESSVIIAIAVPLIILFFVVIAWINVRTRQKILQTRQVFSSGNVEFKNIDPRTRSWYASLVLIGKKPVFGVGLNARDKLAEEYKTLGYTTEAELRLNSHNQYLETQLTIGVSGTIVLLWMLFIPVIFRKKLWCLSAVWPFFIIVSFSMIFESILVRQWGIMFFVLFYCIIALTLKE
ncbi:MAG: O-antigen ligase family protein [Bacteroidales bacterium]